MIVRLRESDPRYPDLTAGQRYLVIGIEADDYRILNDRGQPYLYPHDVFDVVDATEPEDWLTERGDDQERYSYPQPLNRTGFFEDFFDDRPDAVATFWRIVNERLAALAA